jgi:hypothetical protein
MSENEGFWLSNKEKGQFILLNHPLADEMMY